MSLFDISGKRILVTGASSGIGKGLSLMLASQGAEILITGRNTEQLRQTLQSMPGENHHLVAADLSQSAGLEAIVASSDNLDGIVLNAGMMKTMPMKFLKGSDLRSIFEVNIISSVMLVNALLRKNKIKDNASICFISSIASVKPTIANSVYAASKGAVNSFCKALALELAPRKIRVNAVLPGMVETSMITDSAIDDEMLKKHLENYPLGRFGTPEDIAGLVVYLMSPLSGWMTGSLINIDGGFSLK